MTDRAPRPEGMSDDCGEQVSARVAEELTEDAEAWRALVKHNKGLNDER